jgi:GDPmannose 4,6-dehydratase
MKTVLILGANGQDGSYLSEFLLNKNYYVVGVVRRSSTFNTERIDHLKGNDNFRLYHGDLTDPISVRRIIDSVQPDEVYNLASQTHVSESFSIPVYTSLVNAIGTLILLDIIKEVNPKIKYYQASSSEIFGGIPGSQPQSESTPFYPKSPYACSKIYAYYITINYRESYGIHASNGILFNHESERRLPTFVTRKITYGISQVLKGKQNAITLGNLNSRRDWGYSPDYVEAMWMMLQQEKPQDLVIATGETHTVREFVEEAFKHIGVNIGWQGKNEFEEGYDLNTGMIWIRIDPKFYRPSEVQVLQGDYSKAKSILGWQPKTTFKELVKIMMEYDCKDFIK